MSEKPTLVGHIQFSQPSGAGGFQMHYRWDGADGPAYWGRVDLYAWSDGVVTWTRERG